MQQPRPHIAILLPSYGLVERGTENFIKEFTKYLADDFTFVIFAKKKTSVSTRKVICIWESNKILNYIYNLHPIITKMMDRYYLNPSHFEAFTFSIGVLPILLREKYDLLFPQSGVWGAIVCRIIRLLKKTPFIYRSGGGIEPQVARQNPDRYFCINPAIEKWFNIYFPDMKTTFISNGVDAKQFNPKGKKARVTLRKPIVITVAALIEQKRLDLTIQAVGKIKGASLLVIGQGPLLKSLTALAQKYIGANRFLFSAVSHDQLPKYLRAADVFAFSAPNELGWGLVHLEAMATGIPIVANNESNLKQLVGSPNFLCDVKNIDAYKTAIQKALKHPRSFRKRVLQYSWPYTAKRYKNYLHEIIRDQN